MENTIYEVSYLLLPNISPEQAMVKVGSLKDKIASLGGGIISDENPVLIDLAYSMTKVVQAVRHKVSTGYFSWVKFEISNENEKGGVGLVKKMLDTNDNVLRYLIIKTVRENTLLSGKMKLGNAEKIKPDQRQSFEEEEMIEPAKEMILEDVDKSIDDLVIV